MTKTLSLNEIQSSLYLRAKKRENFKSLSNLIESEENIIEAYKKIRKNKGSHTPGPDGRSIKDLDKETRGNIIRMVRYKLNNHKPGKVKRIYIPKANGSKRPLGIPNIIDRVTQQAVLQILDPICEANFYKGSYGFRPLRSATHAVADIYKKINLQKLHYAVSIDIEGFFDNVNHNKLIRQMWAMGIRDKKVLNMIKNTLKSEIVEPDGSIIKPDKGTPQGGVISPILSNIVLNELDWWIASQWEEIPTRHQYMGYKHKNGKRSKNPKYNALRKTNLKEIYIVRYADDFVILCRSYEDANKIAIATTDWLKERLKLSCNKSKTKVVSLKKDKFNFLGIDIGTVKKGNKYVVNSNLPADNIKRLKEKHKKLLVDIAHSSGNNRYLAIKRFNSSVMGVHNYYSMATNVAQAFLEVGEYQRRSLKSRRPYNRELSKTGKTELVHKNYSNSLQVRFLGGIPILPLSYIKHRKPMMFSSTLERYTKEGMEKLKTSDKLEMERWIEDTYVVYRSIEFNINRVSKWKAQRGLCSISRKELDPTNMEIHHILPVSLGGTDEYGNLVALHKDIHKLIHMTDTTKINKIIKKYKLKSAELKKVNRLRRKSQNENIVL